MPTVRARRANLSGEERSSSNTTALGGIRVLDLATFVAAPFCATMMAEFGAEVIKVEMPGRGDPLRQLGESYNGVGLLWAQENRNKKGITCDLRLPKGQGMIQELVKRSDVLVENFRPGTMERWNQGYEVLTEVNPRIVMVRISAYGQTGPYRSKAGFGRVAQAFGGLTYLAGFPDRPPVNPGSATIADYLAGMFGAFLDHDCPRASPPDWEGSVYRYFPLRLCISNHGQSGHGLRQAGHRQGANRDRLRPRRAP